MKLTEIKMQLEKIKQQLKERYTPQVDEKWRDSIISRKGGSIIRGRIERLRSRGKYRGAYIAEKEFMVNGRRDSDYAKLG